MTIHIVTPSPSSHNGNGVTAQRWARLLRTLGHGVSITQRWRGERCDALIALHARKSGPSIKHFARLYPKLPLIIALTGTDLYQNSNHTRLWRTLKWARHIVVLQPAALARLPRGLRGRARVIFQSVPTIRRPLTKKRRGFSIAVVAHLRPVKDPWRVERAVQHLPASSRIFVRHAGRQLNPSVRLPNNPRYRWLGELPRFRARRLIAQSQLLVLPSIAEGGANVISEAIVAGVPVIASRIEGSMGLLGADYPGFFGVRNTRELRALLLRAEIDAEFLGTLRSWCQKLHPLFHPVRERQAWRALLKELYPPQRSG